MTDLDAFREQTLLWLFENAPVSLRGTRRGRFDGYWGGRKREEVSPDVKRWFEAMLERGWTAPTWPKRYGGGELSTAEGKVLDEELARLELPPPLVGVGLTMIGPTLLDFGSEEQKLEHLPRICRGEVRWCQGYSEPGAGSDLASLNTRAVRDGDDFVVTGQKIWTSYADISDWMFCLVRTDPTAKKQAGISFLLIDMQSAGVSTKNIKLISGASPFCEVFFDAVRVPARNVVGDVNGGWTIAKALLGYERSMVGQAMGGQLVAAEQSLVALARRELATFENALPDAELRVAIAKLAMDERAYRLAVESIERAVNEGRAPGPESSILKICGSELKQRRWELAARIAGPQALGWQGPGFDADELELTRQWLRSRANSIEGGTTEIQLNIIAKRVLLLPD
jgi:alkylation response protein AidB-like acyl-CoA dehydrogenase